MNKVAALKEGGAGNNTMLEDLGSGMEVVTLKKKEHEQSLSMKGRIERMN